MAQSRYWPLVVIAMCCKSYEPGPCEEGPPAGQACRRSKHACGCEATDNCILDPTAGVMCIKAGSKQLNQACADDSECTRGFACINLIGASGGLCKAICESDADCAGGASGGWRCEEIATQKLRVCNMDCSPLNETACGPEAKCDLIGPEPVRTGCILRGDSTKPGGCPAGTPEQCAAGFGCFSLSGKPPAQDCVRWCVVKGANCPDGRPCNEIPGSPFKIGQIEYGICAP